MTETVVITGASAESAGPTAELFGRRGANVVLIARGEDGLRAAAAGRCRRRGGTALAVPADVADFAAVERAAQQAEDRFGPIDVWVNVAFASVFAPFWEIKPEEFRRVTEVSYLGFVHGTMAALARMRPARPRHGRPGRLGARLPGDPAAVRVLRRQARHQRVHRVGPHELLHEGSQGSDHHRADASRQHPPVQLGAVPAAAPPAAGPADLPARGRRRRGSCSRPITRIARSTGSARPRSGTIVAQKFAAPLLDQYLARTGYDSQQTKEQASRRAIRATSGSRSTSRPAATRARTAASTTSPSRAAPSSPSPSGSRRPAPPSAAPSTACSAPAARAPRSPSQSAQETWSEATSQQTDQDASRQARTPPRANRGHPVQLSPPCRSPRRRPRSACRRPGRTSSSRPTRPTRPRRRAHRR